jgi:hypothetical protein
LWTSPTKNLVDIDIILADRYSEAHILSTLVDAKEAGAGWVTVSALVVKDDERHGASGSSEGKERNDLELHFGM